MTEAVDPVTIALTGHLPFHLVLAALITWPTALGLLGLYSRLDSITGRHVRQLMRSLASAAAPLQAITA